MQNHQHQNCTPVWVIVDQKIWSGMSCANCRPSSDILCKITTTNIAPSVRIILHQKTLARMSDANRRPRSDILCEIINSKITPEFRVIRNQRTWTRMSDANCRPRSDILCKILNWKKLKPTVMLNYKDTSFSITLKMYLYNWHLTFCEARNNGMVKSHTLLEKTWYYYQLDAHDMTWVLKSHTVLWKTWYHY